MDRLRGTLNPEEEQFAIDGPTKYRTKKNRYGVHCCECGSLFYVDEYALRKALAAQEGDRSEIAFSCADCEVQYEEEARAH
jgi:hypothetical protein